MNGSITHTDPAPTLGDVWRLFQETDRILKENAQAAERRFQETDRILKENAQAAERRFQETDRILKENAQAAERRYQETDRILKENAQAAERRSQETDRILKENAQAAERRYQETDRILKENAQAAERRSQETDRKFQATDHKLNQLEKLFTSQWGRLVESLVEGALVRIFNERGIPIRRTATRVRGNYQGQDYEFDILVHNGEALIIVEVKTTLRPKYVTHFLDKLDQAKVWLPEYAHNQIYGAMAFLQADAGAELMVMKRGMFAIRATGDSANIVNPQGCELRVW